MTKRWILGDATEGRRQADRPRVWAPWRMRYVAGERTPGCVFCHYAGAPDDDPTSLVIARFEHTYLVLNRYPYGTGHLMAIPYEHAASPEDAAPAALAEMAQSLPLTLRALRRALGCDGFNVGINVGSAAGAGIAAHLHQHVVPRWAGDSNFMPVLAGVQVMPELLPVTYAKLRAEIRGELVGGDGAVTSPTLLAVLTPDGRIALTRGPGGSFALPEVAPDAGENPAWRAARDAIAGAVPGWPIDLVGWAGEPATDDPAGVAALAWRVEVGDQHDPPGGPWEWRPVGDAVTGLPPSAAVVVERARALLG